MSHVERKGRGDIITVEKTDGEEITVSCDTEGVPTDKRNIVYKCAEKFFEYADITENKGIHIHIEKHTPFCAGMGGGSADGAAVLVALNKIFNTNYSEKSPYISHSRKKAEILHFSEKI